MRKKQRCINYLLTAILFFVIGFSNISAPAFAANHKFNFPATPNTAAPFQRYEPDALLVKYKATVSDSDVKKSANRQGALTVKHLKVHGQLPKNKAEQWRKLKFRKGEDLQSALERLKQDPKVDAVEFNYTVVAYDAPQLLPPAGGFFSELWGMDNYGQALGAIIPGEDVPGGTPDADIDAPEAWNLHTGNGNVVVAVIDTGVDYTHHDLIDNIWANPSEIPGNAIDDDNNGYVDDIRGWDFVNDDNDPMDDDAHGTHVSGTIAGIGGNNFGVAGVSWSAKIMPLKFIDGNTGKGTTDDAILALNYATKMGAKITNNSWGCMGACFSQALYDAIQAANTAGVLFVAAAGNSGLGNAGDPARYDLPNIISVAATGHNDDLAFFSNYNPVSVDLGAPGVNVLSSLPDLIYATCPECPVDNYGDYYGWGSGTSMASPHVAGAAALLKSLKPNLSSVQIKDKILKSVDQIPSLTDKTLTGGRLNVHRMLNNFHFLQSVSPSNQMVLRGNSVTYTISYISFENWVGTLNLSMDSDNEITGTIDDNVLTIPAGGTATTTITLSASSTASYGIHHLTVHAVDQQGVADTLNIYLTVTPDADLVLMDVSTSEIDLPIGGAATVNTTLKNQGTEGTTVNTRLNFYLSSDATITTDDTFIGSRIFNPIAAGASYTISTNLTIPVTVATGTYYLGAIADVGYAQLEIIESNNALAGMSVTASIKTDVLVSSIPTTASSLPIGGSIEVSAVLQNQGASPTTSKYLVGFYLSTDPTITTSDIRIDHKNGPSISAGASSTISTNALIPSNLVPGTLYYIGVIADLNNELPETDETNNGFPGPFLTAIRDVDLVTTAVSTTAANLPINGSIPVTTTIKNQGTTPTTNSYSVGIYLSTDAVITAADIFLGYKNVPALAAGASSTVSLNLPLPASLTPDTYYYLGAIADYYNNGQPETDETNNAFTGPSLVAIRDVDLITTAVTTTAANLPINGSIPVSATIKNQGTTSTTNSYSVGIYLSTDAVITAADIFLGYKNVPALAADASSTVSLSVPLPADLTLDAYYYLGAIADFGNGTQPETDEMNNALAGASLVAIRDVDLVMTAVSTTATSLPINGAVSFSTTVKNLGTTPAANFNIGIYLSTDSTITDADTWIGTRSLSSLAAGASSTANTTRTIPASLAPGAYYLGAIADFGNGVQPETNETNNALTGVLLVAVRDVDLIMTAVSTTTTSVAGGGSATVSTTIRNQGTTPTTNPNYLGIYLSTDATITTADTKIGVRGINTLAAGANSTANTTITIPLSVAPGMYYLGAFADYGNAQLETDETNNGLTGSMIEVMP